MNANRFVACICLLMFPPAVQAMDFSCPSPGDPGGACLVAAITAANANGQANRIILGAGNYFLRKVNNASPGSDGLGMNGLPLITSNLLIVGLNPSGSRQTTIERVNGAPPFRIFQVAPTGKLTLQRLTVRGGQAPGLFQRGGGNFRVMGGGIFVEARGEANLADVVVKLNDVGNPSGEGANYGFGGGIAAAGDLTIINSDIVNNTVHGIEGAFGGGIAANGRLTIVNSTVGGNIVRGQNMYGAAGGGISSTAAMTIIGSTISDNTVGGNAPVGGGIFVGNVANRVFRSTIVNSTISGNSSLTALDSDLGGGIFNTGDIELTNVTITGNIATEGAGIVNDFETKTHEPTARVKNTLIANASSSNCRGSLISRGHNIDSDGTCALTGSRDQISDPMLGPLANNGGGTLTHALLPGSPAIDAIAPPNCTDLSGNAVIVDQRGVARPKGKGCDIGAFESLNP